jgi:hypothetical protein
VRFPAQLHRRPADEAAEAGVSMNRIISPKLAQAPGRAETNTFTFNNVSDQRGRVAARAQP